MKRLPLAIALVCAAAWAVPSIPRNSVKLVENNEGDAIKVSYVLSGDPAVVTLSFEADGAPVDETRYLGLSGDVNCLVQPGARLITLRGYTPFWTDRSTVKATLRAWCTNSPPDYMVVHLTNTPVNVNYYANTNAIPGGVGDRYHKSFGITLRKIPAAGRVWSMGKPPLTKALDPYETATRHDVKLTEDYYIGVYEFTYGNLHGAYPDKRTNTADWRSSDLKRWGVADNTEYPLTLMAYAYIRGQSDYGEFGAGWPAAGHDLSTTTDHPSSGFNPSLIRYLRQLTDIEFDLPTEAQWEFACRGDGTIPFYNGYPDSVLPYEVLANYYEGSGIYHKTIDDYAWHFCNSSNENSRTVALHPVGQKLPNSYGLYDMLGNAIEWMLDFSAAFDTSVRPAVDPVGPTAANALNEGSGYMRPKRVLKGGSYNLRPAYANAFMRFHWVTGYTDFGGSAAKQSDSDYCYRAALGLRLACPALAIK